MTFQRPLSGTVQTAFAFKVQYTPYQSLQAVRRPITSSRYINMYLYTNRDRYKLNGKLTKRCATHLTYIYFAFCCTNVPILYAQIFDNITVLQKDGNSIQYIKYDGTSVRIPLLSRSLRQQKVN